MSADGAAGAAQKTIDLTEGDIGRHLRRLAVPASMGFFFTILFNATDTYFAGWLSTDAQAAMAFSFPLYFIMLALAVGLSQAIAGLSARSLGGGKPRQVRYYIGQIAAAIAAVGVACAVGANIVAGPLLDLLGASADQRELSLDYIRWIFAFSFLFVLTMVMSGILSSHGNTKTYRNALVAAAIINVPLNPTLMFGWLGLPALGMHGLALATLIAETMMVCWMLPVVLRLPSLQGFRWLHLYPRMRALVQITRQAIPATLNMGAICCGFMVNTYFLASIDTLAVAAYGIALRIEQMVLILGIGLNIALLSIAGQNFGARNYRRLHETYKTAIKYGFVMVALGGVFMLALGQIMVKLFNSEEAIVEYGYQYLITATVIGPFYILGHNSTAVLQAIGKPAMIGPIGILRLLVLPLVLCWLFVIQLDQGAWGVWFSLILANVVATAILAVYTSKALRRVAPLPSQ